MNILIIVIIVVIVFLLAGFLQILKIISSILNEFKTLRKDVFFNKFRIDNITGVNREDEEE